MRDFLITVPDESVEELFRNPEINSKIIITPGGGVAYIVQEEQGGIWWPFADENPLAISRCNKHYVTGNKTGCMTEVTESEALNWGDWFYDPKYDLYFIVTAGNPDRESPADKAERELYEAIADVCNPVSTADTKDGLWTRIQRLKAIAAAQKPRYLK